MGSERLRALRPIQPLCERVYRHTRRQWRSPKRETEGPEEEEQADAGPTAAVTANDIVDKDMFLGVEDKCPYLAKAATSKAETADFKEVFDDVSKYNKQPDC